MTATFWYVLSAISFAVGIFFFIKVQISRKKRPPLPPLEKRSIEEILREAKKIAESLEKDNPGATSEILLIHILNEIRTIPYEIGHEIRQVGTGITGLIYFITGLLFGGEFLIIALLWSLI